MKYAIVSKYHERAMRLQSVGIVLGTPAGELKEGDVLMWNFGQTSTVEKIVKETSKMIEVLEV